MRIPTDPGRFCSFSSWSSVDLHAMLLENWKVGEPHRCCFGRFKLGVSASHKCAISKIRKIGRRSIGLSEMKTCVFARRKIKETRHASSMPQRKKKLNYPMRQLSTRSIK